MGTKNESATRTKMLRAIYFGKKRLPHLDADAFDKLVSSATGGNADLGSMDARDMGKVLDAMRKAGFAPKDGEEAAPMRGRIKHIWAEMLRRGIVSKPDGHEGYCHRLCKRGLDSLTVKQCQIVIESLKRWWERESGTSFPAGNQGEQ